MVGVIQASWNWPIGRKDMEVYGLKGVLYADNRNDMRSRIGSGYDDFSEEEISLAERNSPFNDPFIYFASVIRGNTAVPQFDLSSLDNNMIVMEILDAAIKSARKNKTIYLKP